MEVKFNIPYLAENQEKYTLASLRSLRHCGNLAYGKRCVDYLKKRYNFGEVFLTPSCTAAMEMGAILAELGVGDEVILPSYTFSSTANAVVLRGVKPVFCEVSKDTLNINVDHLESLITKKTKMILPNDYAGIPCEIDRIMNC